MKLSKNNWSFTLTLGIALLLVMIEIPDFGIDFLPYLAPDFALLVCFYWATNPSARVSLIVPWAFGFLFDAVHAHPLGLNGLIYCIVVFVGLNLPRRSNRPIVGYQLLGLLGLVTFAEIVRLIALQFVEFSVQTSVGAVAWSLVASFLVWFLVVVVLDGVMGDDESSVSFS